MAFLGGAMMTLASVTAHAQPTGKVRRIAFLSGGSRESADVIAGFPQGMQDLGYVEGKDFVIEYRFANSNYNTFSGFANEFVRSGVDVFVLGTMAAVRPVREVTSTIPIVMGYSTDPVGNGFAQSLARPAGNVTGLAGSADDSAPKQLELLRSVVPNLSRVGYLSNPGNPNSSSTLAAVRAAASSMKLTVAAVELRNPAEIEAAFTVFAKDRVQAIAAAGDALFMVQRSRIAELALAHRLPSMFVQREYVIAGGLMSYGENLKDFFRRAATFVDKIFKGAKPGELPIEQPTQFKLAINRKTADALGITIPTQLYIFADEVIE
jgi:putative ABC transport system substrate-binding protein